MPRGYARKTNNYRKIKRKGLVGAHTKKQRRRTGRGVRKGMVVVVSKRHHKGTKKGLSDKYFGV